MGHKNDGNFVDIPNPDHKSVVYYSDGSTSTPDMIRLRMNKDGRTFHGFPIDPKTAEAKRDKN